MDGGGGGGGNVLGHPPMEVAKVRLPVHVAVGTEIRAPPRYSEKTPAMGLNKALPRAMNLAILVREDPSCGLKQALPRTHHMMVREDPRGGFQPASPRGSQRG